MPFCWCRRLHQIAVIDTDVRVLAADTGPTWLAAIALDFALAARVAGPDVALVSSLAEDLVDLGLSRRRRGHVCHVALGFGVSLN